MDPGTDSDTRDMGENSPEGSFSDASLPAVWKEELDLKSALLESMLDGVIAHTLQGEIVYVNALACRMFGYTHDEFLSLEPWGWVREPELAAIPERLALVKERGELVFESLAPRDDGAIAHTEIHTHLTSAPPHGEFVVSVIRDVTERFAASEKMRYLAFHDPLTGLPNRPNFEERLRVTLSEADRHDDLVGVIYLDLDDFKPINDSFGHSCGDKVLKVIAERLVACVRDSDMAARMGGDEFIFLFPRLCMREDLAVISKSLVDCVSAPIAVDDAELRLGASVGLAIYRRGETTDDLITRADHAMYHAKLNGLLGWEEFVHGL